MDKKKEIVFNDSENMFNDILEEYDYRMMLAKDETISFVLFEMAKHLGSVYDQLSSESNITKIIVDLKEEKEKDFEMLVKTTYANECICFKSEDAFNNEVENYKCIKVYLIEDGEDVLLYEMIFDTDMSYIVIQNIDDILVYSILEDYVMDNTFSDVEITAILYTLSFMIGSVIDNKPKKNTECKVINIKDYRRKKAK